MAENKLADMSTKFAIHILKLTDGIKGHYSLASQLERSFTSIGANIREAKNAHGNTTAQQQGRAAKQDRRRKVFQQAADVYIEGWSNAVGAVPAQIEQLLENLSRYEIAEQNS